MFNAGNMIPARGIELFDYSHFASNLDIFFLGRRGPGRRLSEGLRLVFSQRRGGEEHFRQSIHSPSED